MNAPDYAITTRINGTAIVQELAMLEGGGLDDVVRRFSRSIAETSDAHVRQKLIELGWTPPDHPVAKLARFGLRVLKAHRLNDCADVDGGSLQDMAVEAGALERREIPAPCGENCACAWAGASFPTDCYFVPEEIQPLMKD